MAATLLRRLAAAIALPAAVLAGVLAAPASPASADPEGGTKTLRAALESSARGHAEAKVKLAASQKRQKQFQTTLLQSQVGAKQMQTQVTLLAGRVYRLGRFNAMSMLLSSSSPDAFLDRAKQLNMMATVDASTLARYREAVDTYTKATAAVKLEIAEQQKQVKILASKKREAELALAAAGGGRVSGGFIAANSPFAKPAPRSKDGSWPTERCTVDDPTTSGCITPRLLNAYQQARKVGFTRYTSCFSERDSGEHPKGRACDFAADKGGFGGAATGASRSYGNDLAAYFVKNADRLGVMYVIWFKEIWQPSTGWRTYSGGGSPSAAHTNHVHLSML